MAEGWLALEKAALRFERWLVITSTSPRLHLTILLLLAIPFHAVVFTADRSREMWDTESYLMPARSLAAGLGYVAPDRVSHALPDLNRKDSPLKPETIRTPLYPAYLALFLQSPLTLEMAVLVQHLIHIVLVLAAYLFLAAMTGDRRTAFLAAALYALWPASVRLSDQLVSEPLFSLFFLPAAALLLKAAVARRNAIAPAALSALLVGGSVLVRPAALYYFLAAALFLALFARRRRFLLVLVFVALSQVVPLAWAARNHHATGVFTVSSLTGESALFFKAAGALAVKDRGAWYAVSALAIQDDFYRNVLQERRRLLAEVAAGTGSEALHEMHHAQRSQRYVRLAAERLRAHPLEFVTMALGSVAHMFLSTLWQPAVEMNLHPRWRPQLMLLAAVLAMLAVRGLVITWRRDRRLAALALVTVAYFAAVSAGSEADYRLLEPASLPYLLLIAAGLPSFTRT
jgi:4-amino-4-deoxy-L-arabinose transferase-like glycosyltransferase